MLARRQELNTQILQVVDALLLAVALFTAYGLRLHSTISIAVSELVDPLQNYYWLAIVVVLFGPILLELQGFYQSPINRTKWKTLEQILRAMIALSIVVGACVIFLKQPLHNRTVPVFFILIATVLLLVKEQMMTSYFRRRAARGESREPILLAGRSGRYRGAGRNFYAGAAPSDGNRRSHRYRKAAHLRFGGSDASPRRVSCGFRRRPQPA